MDAQNTMQGLWLGLSRTANSLKVVAGAMAIIEGVKFLKNTFVDAQKVEMQWETMRYQLNALYGDARKGGRAFEWVKQFALTSPFEIDELLKGFKMLGYANITPTRQLMSNIATMAKFSTRTFEQTAMAIVQASRGNIRRLLYFGIDRKTLDALERRAQQPDFAKATEVQRMNILFAEMEKRNKGMMKEMAKDTTTALQNMHQAWQEFEVEAFGTGSLKKSLIGVLTNALNLLREMVAYGKIIGETLFLPLAMLLSFMIGGPKRAINMYKYYAEQMQENAKIIQQIRNPNAIGEPPGVPRRGTQLNPDEEGAGGMGGASQLARAILFGGKFAGIGVNATQLPGINRGVPNRIVTVKVVDAEGKSLGKIVEEAVNKTVQEMIRNGQFAPAGG